MIYHRFLPLIGLLAACYSPLARPSWPGVHSIKSKTAKYTYPPGFLTIPSDTVALRNKLTKLTDTQISRSLLEGTLFQTPKSCILTRLGPSTPFTRQVEIQFSRTTLLDSSSGFGVTATFTRGTLPEESTLLSLWYDFHGHLVTTVTLPPTQGESEKAGTREEFFVFTFLPQSQEWVAEGQRLVGPEPKEPWMYLPPALLVDKADPYSDYFRASVYLICKNLS